MLDNVNLLSGHNSEQVTWLIIYTIPLSFSILKPTHRKSGCPELSGSNCILVDVELETGRAHNKGCWPCRQVVLCRYFAWNQPPPCKDCCCWPWGNINGEYQRKINTSITQSLFQWRRLRKVCPGSGTALSGTKKRLGGCSHKNLTWTFKSSLL